MATSIRDVGYLTTAGSALAAQHNLSQSPAGTDEAGRALAALKSGAAEGQQLFGTLPRLSQDPVVTEITQKISDLGRVRTEDELRIERESATKNIDRATQAASRRLEGLLTQRGVVGAQAGRQLSQVELEGVRQKQELEQGLFLGQKAEERAAAQRSLTDVANLQLGARQFDIGQIQAERLAALSTGAAVAQIGAAERGAIIQGSALGQVGKGSSGGFFNSGIGRVGLAVGTLGASEVVRAGLK